VTEAARTRRIAEGDFYCAEGVAKFNEGDISGARASFFKALAIDEELRLLARQSETVFSLCQISLYLEDLETLQRMTNRAKALYQEASHLPPSSHEKAGAYFHLGQCFDLANELQLAEDVLRQSSELNVVVGNSINVAASWMHLGHVYDQQGKYELAERAYLKAHEINLALGRLDVAENNMLMAKASRARRLS